MRQEQNAEVLDRSLFLNALLARKGVSWTRIFADLEQVTPHNVRVITVRPQISTNNELLLDMVVGSQAVEPILNFVMQLEGSTVFGKTTVHTTIPPSQTEPLYRSRVTVNYAQKL
jgi:type IV pilus assembly protein PilN